MWAVRCEKMMTLTAVVNGIQMNGPDLNVRIQFYDDHIVRVLKWPYHGSPDKSSLSVIQDSVPEIGIRVEEEADGVTLKSAALTVFVSRSNGAVQFFGAPDKLKLSENGRPGFMPMSNQYESSFHVQQKFLLTSTEGLYGLGQHQDGIMNYRNKEVILVQSNTEAVIPFLISTRNYGILWDNCSKTVFRGTNEGAEFRSDVGDQIDYYFIAGESMDGVIRGYRDLTGQAPLYGKWAYGYWQSREHYENRDELMSVATEYRRRRIPIDNMIQDWETDDRRTAPDALSPDDLHLACAGSEYPDL